ncbi:MAG: NADH-quinone oxidoreductase subunit L [Bauldia sp.]
MYQAIVFLPLLGAIIAGAIAFVGASARVRGPAHLAHDLGHAADNDHGDGHGHVPEAAGSAPAQYITSGFVILSAILSWIAFFSVGFGDAPPLRVGVVRWLAVGTMQADWALRIDTLTVVMLVVVTTVSALVHVYSIGYMAHDPHRPRFFAYLSLFTFAMLALVTADNLLQLFFGWEGVGLASYLLIGFWFDRPSANAAAIKAFIVNRVGDVGFALGIFGVYFLFDSIDFQTIFAGAPAIAGRELTFLWLHVDALEVVCLLLFMGAMGKSAQFLLHTWLPDAMEGPTPVSALIHAATMVTAGVFMVARLSPLFAEAHVALAVVAVIGATTAFFAATVGLVQNDIKRVIAYSTCSQLGYMFIGLGLGAPATGMFHLFTHAFFKALLFLGAGSVIHAVAGEQDMRKMGGLSKALPLTYWAMVIGTLALTGFPLTAGFFSKDAIIETAYATGGTVGGYAFVLAVVTALLTSFYSWRLIFLTFHGERREPAAHGKPHESPLAMLVPLGILAFGALVAGFAFLSSFVGSGSSAFWRESIQAAHAATHEAVAPPWVQATPILAMVIGFLFAFFFYILSPQTPRRLAEANRLLYRFLLNKWYFDELYDFLFVRPALWLGRLFWRRGDGQIIDGLGPDGISGRVLDVTRSVVRLQSGYVFHYALAMLLGLLLLVSWLVFKH